MGQNKLFQVAPRVHIPFEAWQWLVDFAMDSFSDSWLPTAAAEAPPLAGHERVETSGDSSCHLGFIPRPSMYHVYIYIFIAYLENIYT